jgi:hypothetical protein
VKITKTTTADGFVVVDLPEAGIATGIVRCARKILQDGAVNMARSLTYSYAAFGIPTSGASAGINADGEGRDEAVAAFVAELAPEVAAGSLRLAPGKGVTAADVAAWSVPEVAADSILADGVVAAAAAAGELSGASVGIEAGAPAASAIAEAFTAAGAVATVSPLAELLTGGAAVVVVGSKPAVLDHDNIGSLGPATILASAGLSLTARALATGRRNGAVILPDFVTAAGPVLAATGETEVAGRIAAVVAAVLGHDEGPYLGGCYAAEDYLRTWVNELPFGRPLA